MAKGFAETVSRRRETDFADFATGELAVSFGSSLDAKELVRQAIDIVELVGKYIQLRRQGRNYVGLCPWHADSRPSLQINPERQSFKCWVCDIGGDVFSFVMKMEGVTFPEAMALLADQAGVQLKPSQGKERGAADKRALFQAMAWAEKQYQECLLSEPEAEPARRYLAERGITAQSVEKFHLGFSPNRWDWILRRGREDGVNQRVLEQVGLLTQGTEGKPYDRFRGRVLFSIRDVQGRPVGLGGRVLPESGNTSPAKYVNSPETPLFAKSSLLYGLDVAREAVRKSRTAMVMEGYTDVIVAHQFGFDNAVAVLGTALGPKHVQILKRFADRIVLVLDGDEAGQRRAKEILDLFVTENVDLHVAILPDDLDPCELLLERGAEALRKILADETVDALEHAKRVWTVGIDFVHDVHAATQALDRLVSIVAKAPRLRDDTKDEFRFREERILQRLAFDFRVPEQTVRQRLTALRRATQQRKSEAERSDSARNRPAVDPQAAADSASAGPEPAGKLDPWQRELMEILVRHPECLPIARRAIAPEQLDFELCSEVYKIMLRLSDGGEVPTFERLMLEFDHPAVKSLLVELDEDGAAKAVSDPKTLLEELIRSFHDRETTRLRPATAGMLREGRLDENQEIDLLQQIVQQERNRHGISKLTDGPDHASG